MVEDVVEDAAPGAVGGDGPGGVVVGDDGLARCPWAAGDPEMAAYHDTEWGVPAPGERAHFERLSLEAFQSGLSWRTILRKRPAFRAAFADFEPDAVAAYDEGDVARLLADAGIVRHRAKIEATRTNARATVALRADGGLEALVASFRPPPGPPPRTVADLAARTDASLALSRALRARGFTFVGPTTMHALLQALGYLDDHLVGCHRRGVAAGAGPAALT